MGYNTHFYGKLQFTRKLTPAELTTLGAIIDGDDEARQRLLRMVMFGDDGNEISDALLEQAQAERAIKRGGKGPLIFDPHAGADLVASRRNLITGDGLSPHYAKDLRISDDNTGLVYCSEKTYDMIAGANFIIANAREQIPGFGLRGHLFAETEFEPYEWLLTINDGGWAEQTPCKLENLPLAEQTLIKEEKLREELSWQSRCAWLEAEEKKELKRTYGFMWPMKEICDRAGELLCRCDWRRREAQAWVRDRLLKPFR